MSTDKFQKHNAGIFFLKKIELLNEILLNSIFVNLKSSGSFTQDLLAHLSAKPWHRLQKASPGPALDLMAASTLGRKVLRGRPMVICQNLWVLIV